MTTLSLWSWSTTAKSRTVGQGWPSLPVPSGGIFSSAARDIAVGRPVEGRAVAVRDLGEQGLAEAVHAVALRQRIAGAGQHQVVAIEAEHDADHVAPRHPGRHRPGGRLGALGDDQRVVHLDAAGARVDDVRLDVRLQVRVGHLAAVAEHVRGGQATRAERVGRHLEGAVHRLGRLGRGLVQVHPGSADLDGPAVVPVVVVAVPEGGPVGRQRDRTARARVSDLHADDDADRKRDSDQGRDQHWPGPDARRCPGAPRLNCIFLPPCPPRGCLGRPR